LQLPNNDGGGKGTNESQKAVRARETVAEISRQFEVLRAFFFGLELIPCPLK
jgi:hypothetical protein